MFDSEDLGYPREVRSEINGPLAGGFLIAFPLVGFATLIWAFVSQPRGRKQFKQSFARPFIVQQTNLSIRNVYNALNSMLFMDVLYGVTSIVLGSAMIQYQYCKNSSMCTISYIIFFISRSFAIIDHLLVALLAILHVCNPLQGFHHRYVYTSICLLIVIISPVYVYVSSIALILLAVIILLLTLAIAIKSRVPVAVASYSTTKKLIVLVAMINFLSVFMPTFVIECMIYTGDDVEVETYANVVLYTSFNIILDGVMCYLALGLASEEDPQQPQEQVPPPQWQQDPSQWQQNAPQYQQPPPQYQQPPPQYQQPPPQQQYGYGYDNSKFNSP